MYIFCNYFNLTDEQLGIKNNELGILKLKGVFTCFNVLVSQRDTKCLNNTY